ncbi:MAG: class I SAM-dependent methyltransferase, partial [Gammaproteobacteria bacterium]
INHHCFGGNRDFRDGFRCLVAGGGTGDCLIFLAEQLRDFGAEIVYVDFSAASRRVAEQRARVRKLDNIDWVTASIMDIGQLRLGEFDFINCSGVLHHLESPAAGLDVLAGALKPGGAMYLMLYGTYGRRAIYDMQALLAEYLPEDADAATKLRLTRQLIASLPESNSFRRDLQTWAEEISTDAGLYDLLLHSRDVSFTVPEIYALVRHAGLSMLGFTGIAASRYDCRTALTDPDIRRRLEQLDTPQQQAVAEKTRCDIGKHEFFVGRDGSRAASLDDEDNAIIANGSLYLHASEIAASMIDGKTLNYEDQTRKFSIDCNPVTRIMFAHMGGVTALRELYDEIVARVPDVDARGARAETARIFRELHGSGFAYLLRAGAHGTRLPDYARLIQTRARPA